MNGIFHLRACIMMFAFRWNRPLVVHLYIIFFIVQSIWVCNNNNEKRATFHYSLSKQQQQQQHKSSKWRRHKKAKHKRKHVQHNAHIEIKYICESVASIFNAVKSKVVVFLFLFFFILCCSFLLCFVLHDSKLTCDYYSCNIR